MVLVSLVQSGKTGLKVRLQVRSFIVSASYCFIQSGKYCGYGNGVLERQRIEQ